MKKMLIMAALLVSFITSAIAAGAPSRLAMKPPTRDQLKVINKVLGKDFVKGEDGAMAPELLVSSVDLNHDGTKDLIAVQRGVCSNHTCDFEILLNRHEGWKQVGSFESWSIPYIEASGSSTPANIIIFENLSDDSMAEVSPTPVRYKWSPKDDTYVDAGVVKGKKLRPYSFE